MRGGGIRTHKRLNVGIQFTINNMDNNKMRRQYRRLKIADAKSMFIAFLSLKEREK